MTGVWTHLLQCHSLTHWLLHLKDSLLRFIELLIDEIRFFACDHIQLYRQQQKKTFFLLHDPYIYWYVFLFCFFSLFPQNKGHMFFCNTCSQPLCDLCREETHKAKMFARHEIILLSKKTKEVHKRCGKYLSWLT